VSYRSNDYDVVRGFVRCGLGVALVPALGHVADPGVVTCRLAGMTVYRHVEVLDRPAIRNPAVEGVVAALVAAAGALGAC
jgi:DNA-binding transcriptional LysR family regulator